MKRSRPGQVLGLLLKAQSPASGEEMGRTLGCSRAAVGKAVGQLRDMGFVIEARPRAGYVLVSEPDLLLPPRLEARLPQGSLGLPLTHHLETASSNLSARRWAERGAPHGALVIAEHQTAGRGRLDRTWLAPPSACLLFSLILKPALAINQVFGLTSLASLALCRAIEAKSGLAPRIKWPNDVFLNGRKLAGVLTEFTCRAERVDHVVIGVGLNVNLTAKELAALPQAAESLLNASGEKWDRAELAAAIMMEFTALEILFSAGETRLLADEYEKRFFLTGKMVRVAMGDQVVSGLARGLAPNGSLLLEMEDGTRREIVQGDVTLR